MSARRMSKRVVGAGAAGLAAVFAVAPFAHADPAGPPTSSTPAQPADDAGQSAAKAQQPQGVSEPDYGSRKIRVGVQIKDGSWVPLGTTTGDTKITIAETGPHVSERPDKSTSCRTVEGTQDPPKTETFCEFNGFGAPPSNTAGGVEPNSVPFDANYRAGPGDTVTFTQVTVNKGLVIDSKSQTVGPCVNDYRAGGNDLPICPDLDDVVFTDPGLPPKAVDNHATVVSGHSVAISVLKNDITHGAPAKVDSATQPSHGQSIIGVGQAAAAQTSTSSSAQRATYSITYKSTAPYVGHDKFFYTMSTPNGKSTATVFITVIAPPPIAVNDSARTEMETPVTIDVLNNDDARGGGALTVQSVGTPHHGTATISNGQIVYTPEAGFSGTDTFPYTAATQFGTDTALVTVTIPAALAATGSQTHDLANLGMLLLITGGAATVVGRRRYRAKHAGFH
jgi:hypothetical protein